MKQIYESFRKHWCAGVIIIGNIYLYLHHNTLITQLDLLSMKKLLIITLVTVLCATTAFAQRWSYMDTKNEIALSYGLANFETLLNPVCTWAVDAIGLEILTKTQQNVGVLGTLSFEYYRRVTDLLRVGAVFSYNRFSYLESPTSNIRDYLTLLPAVRLQWYQVDWFSADTKIGVGATYVADAKGDNHFMFSFQASLLGLEVGRRLSGFVEIGIGEQGLIPVGLRYRF